MLVGAYRPMQRHMVISLSLSLSLSLSACSVYVYCILGGRVTVKVPFVFVGACVCVFM